MGNRNSRYFRVLDNESQKLKRKKLLLQMQKEIDELEFQIKNSKSINLKLFLIRYFKVFLRSLQLFTPYFLTAGITFELFHLFGFTPILEDRRIQYLEIKKELDNFGNIRYEEQYDHFNDTKGTISYIGKWQKRQDNFYSREIKTYVTENFSKDITVNFLKNVDITSLDDIFGKPISQKTETKNNLTEEEINKDSYLQAVIYSKSSDDFIIVEESLDMNLFLTLGWIVVTVILESLPYVYRRDFSNFDFDECVEEIKMKYPYIDIDELFKKIKIKKDNYKRLMKL